VSTEKAPNDPTAGRKEEENQKIKTSMTETAPANLDLKRPPSRPQRPRNASDASDFQLFETASMASMASSSMGGGGDQQSYSPPHSPALLATSYEAANRKRLRSSSVSGRLRSASEYLEEKGLLDRQTKGIMKDLIIIGDEELQAAIDRYENGDPSVLEEMIQSGALQNRLPKDLDILGDLDLDFLTMDESALLPPPQMMMMMAPSSMIMDGSSSSHDETAAHQLQQLQHSSCMISPDDDDDDDDQEDDDDDDDDEEQDEDDFDDDIGELDFHSDHDFDQPHDRIASDSPTPELSDHERRMRSNSLYSALINNNPSGNGGGSGNNSAMESTSTYGRWMDPDQSSRRNRHHATMETTILPAVPAFSASSPSASTGTIATRSSTKHSKKDDDDDKHKGPIQIQGKKKGRRPKTASDIQESNLTKSLRDHADKNKKKKQSKQQAKLDKQQQQQQDQQQQQKAPRKPRKPKQQQEPPDDTAMETTSTTPTMEEPVHILGRPRSWSDPQLSVTLDEDGLRNVERPDGWVGAYSPDSRKERIQQFLTKRNLRVWTKSVKYNVRKDFANSRLRVKGRFVKKEDETLMRELMSLT
jgi:CCT motif